MMKKIMVALGIVIVLIVGFLAITSKPNVDELNAESYKMTCEEVENQLGDVDDYEIRPRTTVDGVVRSYSIYDGDEVVAYANVK